MNRNQILLSGILVTAVVLGALFVMSYPNSPPPQNNDLTDFPDFFTKNENYFVTRIGAVPYVDRDTYRLDITGLVDNQTSFSLEELNSLVLLDLPLTIECIGNGPNGKLVGTAYYRGFNVFDLLQSLGIADNATGVRYMAADGYYASHTLDQLENNGVLGALYMNDAELPPIQGFPLRILNPGYYGIKQPAWVTEIEVIDRPLEDYWEDRGWDTSPPIEIDSLIFFPDSFVDVNVSQNLRIGGCALGGTRVKLVEFTIDDGATWNNATIVQQIDADNVWVFWEINTSFSSVGTINLQVRATDINDNQQTKTDTSFLDGTSTWPLLVVNVI